eukprot:7476159-Pyramimonas_sp.AAC.1
MINGDIRKPHLEHHCWRQGCCGGQQRAVAVKRMVQLSYCPRQFPPECQRSSVNSQQSMAALRTDGGDDDDDDLTTAMATMVARPIR